MYYNMRYQTTFYLISKFNSLTMARHNRGNTSSKSGNKNHSKKTESMNVLLLVFLALSIHVLAFLLFIALFIYYSELNKILDSLDSLTRGITITNLSTKQSLLLFSSTPFLATCGLAFIFRKNGRPLAYTLLLGGLLASALLVFLFIVSRHYV